ncbi:MULTISPECIES: hypothetical protein [Chelatococcus]|uniref:hypothetical protein n=1 Tax=Chelatococcus TaxID=28209 RepID=UPI00224BDF23|nr:MULTISPECIES: hypothetical protein [Chelatococcus]MBX3584960.1 hypothetical protein [Rhizobiaceae bacterium]CAH1696754.1 conserved hypothetical protein [Hyphomicrobiales bacterium]MBX3540288.1 hypothetical protein [Chelatococcus sp.]CAH1657012.1 conserved hypothetical protein [Chelatococcus asaccharovorans]CAH1695132.1 conserved hypothetical protein [Chelatococcus asaccharovorans]
MAKAAIDKDGFNTAAALPYELRLLDFENAMQDVYDFFADVNSMLLAKGLQRLDDMTRPAAMSGMISDMITASLARFSRSLVPNTHFNGHPDLVVRGRYANNAVAAGSDGIEIKSTRKEGGAVDTHGAREQWMCVFVYEVDTETEPASARRPMQFTEVYLAQVEESDFRRNARSTDKGTRTATLHAQGVAKLRLNWIYKTESIAQKKRREAKERRDAESAAKKAAKLAARAGAKRTAKKP